MSKKRVLITSIFPLSLPFFPTRFFPLAKNLADIFDFTLLVRGPLPPRERWLDDCNIVEVPPNMQILEYRNWKGLIKKTIRLATDHDILFPQKPFSVTGGLCFFLAKIMRKGFVQDTDDYESAVVKWFYFQEKFCEFFLRKMTKHASVASTQLLEKYWPQGVYIPNCHDLDIWDPHVFDRESIKDKVRTRLGLNKDEALIVWASFFSSEEDTSYMPLVLGIARKKGLKFRLALVGGVPQSENMIAGAPLTRDIISVAKRAGLGQESIIVTGRLPYYEYREVLMSADAALAPLRNHPFDICKSPGRLLKPMALEVPIITTEVGESAYILPRAQCGVLISPNNPESAAEQILKFMSLPLDERRKIGTLGRRYLESQHNPKIVAQRLASLFEKSLNGK